MNTTQQILDSFSEAQRDESKNDLKEITKMLTPQLI